MIRSNALWLQLALLMAAAAASSTAADRGSLAAAARRGDMGRVLASLEAGAAVDAAEPDGTTALHWAVYRDDEELAQTLLDAGADP
ncbi:MAG: ankyrin repeat domain-containing protein, partial [Thermoanaerobaculia bacterium]|nr:ankyrin repeat domain-containing protein [Thermoanaerobaculia bacterium]